MNILVLFQRMLHFFQLRLSMLKEQLLVYKTLFHLKVILLVDGLQQMQ